LPTGSAINGIEQVNYAQYAQGMRQNQNFFKNPQNSFGQTAPPGYVNNQRVAQKSSLEILMENYVMNQSKQLQELKKQTEFLNDSFSKLNTKIDSIATHTKMLETQISQVAQQVAASSQTPGVFLGQTEANPKAHVNAISFGGSKLEETITKTKDIKGGNVKLLSDNVTVEGEKPLDKPKVPFSLSLAKPNLEAQFNKFVNILKKICINIPFAEALSRMPLYFILILSLIFFNHFFYQIWFHLLFIFFNHSNMSSCTFETAILRNLMPIHSNLVELGL